EEVLLAALAVVHAVSLPRHEHVDAEAELTPLLAAFEVRVLSTCVAVDPRGLPGVEDEPALALRDEALLGRLHLGFGHRRIVHETPPSMHGPSRRSALTVGSRRLPSVLPRAARTVGGEHGRGPTERTTQCASASRRCSSGSRHAPHSRRAARRSPAP